MKLYPYQMEGVEYLKRHHYAILADTPGLGKTAQALKSMETLKGRKIVVCPAFLKTNWRNEIKMWVKNQEKDYTVISYSSLHKLEGSYVGVICDEGHALKNPNAKRTNLFLDFIANNRPERLVILTGTPVLNRVSEMFTLIYFCGLNPQKTSGKVMSLNYWQFCRRYCNEIKMNINGRVVSKFEGHRNVPELKNLLKNKYLRRKAEDVLSLPEVVRLWHQVGSKVHEENYKLAYESYVGGKNKHFSSAKAVNALSKALTTSNLAKELVANGEQVIIFSDHVQSVEEIAKLIKHEVGYLHGGIPVDKRVGLIKEFQKGRLRVLVATISTMSVGVNLTNARYVLFNDMSFVPGNNAQAEKRVHRIGQKNKCFIYRVISGPIDKLIVSTITEKMNTINRVVDNERS